MSRSENTVILYRYGKYKVVGEHGNTVETTDREVAIEEAIKVHKKMGRDGKIVVKLEGKIGEPVMAEWLQALNPISDPAKVLSGYMKDFNISLYDLSRMAGVDAGELRDILEGKEVTYRPGVALAKFFNAPFNFFIQMSKRWREYLRDHPEVKEEE